MPAREVEESYASQECYATRNAATAEQVEDSYARQVEESYASHAIHKRRGKLCQPCQLEK